MRWTLGLIFLMSLVAPCFAGEIQDSKYLGVMVGYSSLDMGVETLDSTFSGSSYGAILDLPILGTGGFRWGLTTSYSYMDLKNSASTDIEFEKFSGSSLLSGVSCRMGPVGMGFGGEAIFADLSANSAGSTQHQTLSGVLPYARLSLRFVSKSSNLFFEPGWSAASGILKSARSQYEVRGYRLNLRVGFEF